MRMRKKKHGEERINACAELRIVDPTVMLSGLDALFPQKQPIHMEIGCGKGAFVTGLSVQFPDKRLLAVELVPDVLMMAMEKALSMGLTNVFYIDMDVANMEEIFAAGEIDRLFINFPDPWPRKKNAKRRLTHRGFLDKYCRVVRAGGEIHFKTDNAPLFEFSVEDFEICGLQVNNLTRNLHENGIVGIMTGYEEKFHALGTPINRCEIVTHPIAEPIKETEE